MGEILGVGITHYPPLINQPETYANLVRRVTKSPLVPSQMKNPENWPEAMQKEYANEKALAGQHQERMIEAFRQVRRAIDDFGPDAIIIFGDDQYENFRLTPRSTKNEPLLSTISNGSPLHTSHHLDLLWSSLANRILASMSH